MKGKKYLVLLVEDNRDHVLLERNAVGKVVIVGGIDVASTAQEALSKIKEKKYDLVIVDFNLPGMNGLELIKELKKLKNEAAVVMLTGLGNEKVAVEAMKHGIYDYITKESGYLNHMPQMIESILSKYEYENRLKRAEKEIKEYEAKLKVLIEHSPIAVFMKNRKGEHVLLNGKASEMLRSFSKEVVPQDLSEGLSKTDEDILTKKESTVIEVIMGCKEEEIFFEISKYPILDDGNRVVYICSICRDITLQKKMEKMKEAIIRDLSHEIKTPLSVMAMAYDMCQRALAKNDMEKVKRSQQIAAENVKRLSRNVDNVLDMFRMGEYKKIKEEVELSLEELLREIAKDLEFYLAAKKISLDLKVAKEADKMKANKKDMRTLFYNIIDNAAKFTEEGGIKVDAGIDGDWLVIGVKDTGCGLDEKDKENVFEKFFKKNPALPGTGLGLSICRDIAGLYRGRIDILSDGVGKGTLVKVCIPKERIVS